MLRNQSVFVFVRDDSRQGRVQGGQRFHVALDFLLLLVARQAQVVIGLQSGPHFRTGAKVRWQCPGIWLHVANRLRAGQTRAMINFCPSSTELGFSILLQGLRWLKRWTRVLSP